MFLSPSIKYEMHSSHFGKRVEKALRLMRQPADARLTAEIAREVCERTGGTAVVEGSIASLGSQYVLALRAKNCFTGDVLDDEQMHAEQTERQMGPQLEAKVW